MLPFQVAAENGFVVRDSISQIPKLVDHLKDALRPGRLATRVGEKDRSNRGPQRRSVVPRKKASPEAKTELCYDVIVRPVTCDSHSRRRRVEMIRATLVQPYIVEPRAPSTKPALQRTVDRIAQDYLCRTEVDVERTRDLEIPEVEVKGAVAISADCRKVRRHSRRAQTRFDRGVRVG
jgi:hypothetical protein